MVPAKVRFRARIKDRWILWMLWRKFCLSREAYPSSTVANRSFLLSFRLYLFIWGKLDPRDTFFSMSSPIFISQEDFNLFHAIDRELYNLLVNDLWRDPLESMQVMTLWLWLEQRGFNNVVTKILSLPLSLINEVADEAVTCISCINNAFFLLSSESTEIPLTESLMKEGISLQYFHENRGIVIRGFAQIETEVCFKAFTDIMQHAIRRNCLLKLAAENHMFVSPACYQSSVHPGFAGMGRLGGNMVQGQTQEDEVPPDDRTMFVTFSKGYPVSEREVRQFFTRSFGKCVESLYMQEVPPNEQSLYARIVFFSASAIDMILNGQEKVKYNINGKHIWARKFVPKHPTPRASVSALPRQNLPGAF
ncbi:hypothetical protein F0562_009746 [Nyssa sinensis]|uniref:RRM domain-containing protein n=1 Tax=Nyssa sinensis TaxID=561372 RepID=A0A5J4ZWS9_9ASTE|nr:hypothetical protein F0562_009746 [Nyssa sinensis]